MRQKANPEILAWAEEKAQANTDPNEMMRLLLKAGWFFDSALQIIAPYHPDWAARQQRRPATGVALTPAQRLHTALGLPKKT